MTIYKRYTFVHFQSRPCLSFSRDHKKKSIITIRIVFPSTIHTKKKKQCLEIQCK